MFKWITPLYTSIKYLCKSIVKRTFYLCKRPNLLYNNLDYDITLHDILQKETERQLTSLELIASENFTSKAVLQANGTIFTNKYSEGYPHKRYYGGNEHIDELEELCQHRALKTFHLNPQHWDVNVQSYSGSTANFSVYTGLLSPGDRLMGLDLPAGGHLTHGYATPTKKISNSSIYFESKPYSVGNNFLIDMDDLEEKALAFKPRLIIVGASAYPRDFDYKRFREIADKCRAYLMADIAHISGLVASKLLNNPFEYCDVVTTTTHKTLRGPRAALIFYKKELKEQIDFAVFPSSQGGPHNNTIAAVATALLQVSTNEFVNYSKQVIRNSKYLSELLKKKGFELVTDGTDNHLMIVNLKNMGVTGSKFEKVAELCNISVNKNTIAVDKSALNPSGVRIGTAAMTTRGFVEKDFEFVSIILDKVAKLTVEIQSKSDSDKLVDFMKTTELYKVETEKIKKEVSEYCKHFPLPL
jgi:glycine hydroxymethyltransferase